MYGTVYRSRIRYKERIREMLMEFLGICAFSLVLALCVIFILNNEASKDYYYYVGTGAGYEQLVDRPCTVTEINGDYVTVETCNGGELYTFFGTGYEIGTEIICTFTMADELINTEER